jgi:hypothetical protein
MSGDFGTFNYGGLKFPLSTSSGNSLLQDADPVIFHALAFYSAILTLHMGSRLLAEAAACSAPITQAVAYTTPLDPLPFLQEEHFNFPLLALYRVSEKNSYRTLNWSHGTSKIGIAYVLPPLTPGQAERILPILRAAPLIIANRTEQGFDPAYLNGAKVWSAAFAGLENIEAPVESQYGSYPGVGNLVFPAWTATITVNERQMRETDFGKLNAVDASLDLPTKGDTTITDFVAFKSDIVPPVTPTG